MSKSKSKNGSVNSFKSTISLGKSISREKDPPPSRDSNSNDHPDNTNPENNDKCYEDFDEILELVGSEGKYQKILLWAVICPMIMVQPIFTLNALFMLDEPNHWCTVPGNENKSMTLEEWKNKTIPWEIGPDKLPRHSRCRMFGPDGTNIKCQNGWDYDTTDYDSTIPSEFNWVCKHDHYATAALTTCAIGNCFGTLVLGWGADKYGRKPVFFLTMFINTFFRIVSLFVPQSFYAFAALQFIIGTANPMMYITPNMIVAEISSKKYCGIIYAVGWEVWVVGLASLPLIASLARRWFLIGLITSIPGILMFLYYPAVPESPRWLISVGRVKEATQIMAKIAKVNGKEDDISVERLEQLLNNLAREERGHTHGKLISGFWTLFSKFRLAKNTVNLTISWSVTSLVYNVIAMNASHMSGNQFLNFFILAIIEAPSGWLGGYLVDVTGRRWTAVVFYFIGTLAFILASIGVLFHSLTHIVTAAIVLGKFCINLTFLIVYLQGTEIFPTKLRSTGNGFASTVASAIGISGPYLVFLSKYNAAAPYYSLTLLNIVGLIVSAFLPETFQQNLPESIDDANNFGKGVKFWSYLPNSKKNSSTVGGSQAEETNKMSLVRLAIATETQGN